MIPSLRRLRFRDLDLLVQLDETRNLRKTADLLGITQPAGTKALREIERAFGFALFARTTRKTVPTAAGEVVIAHARSLLASLDLIGRQLDAQKSGLSGERRVGVIPYAAPALMPHVAQVLMRTLPDIKLLVVEGTSEQLIEQLRGGALDLVLARNTAAGDDLAQVPIYRETAVLVVRPAHPLALARKVRHEQLQALSWILPPAGSPTRIAIDVALLRAGIAAPADSIETISVSFLTNLLNSTDMVSVLPRSVASVHQRLGSLKIIPAAVTIELPDLCLYRMRNRAADAAVERIAEQALVSGKALLDQHYRRDVKN